MTAGRRRVMFASLALALLALAGCGQTGPLSLPGDIENSEEDESEEENER